MLTSVGSISHARAARKLDARRLFPKGRSLSDWDFRRPNARDVQAGTAATGGGRVKSAKVERAVGRTDGGRDSNTVTTEAAGAGIGVWARWTVTWAAVQSEQFA